MRTSTLFAIGLVLLGVPVPTSAQPGSEIRQATREIDISDPAKQKILFRNLTRSAEELRGAVSTSARLVVEGQDESVRAAAADFLEAVGPSAAQFSVYHLKKALKDESPVVRRKVADALGSMELMAGAAIPELCKALRDKDVNVRRRVATAIGRIRRDAAVAVPALIQSLTDPDRAKDRSEVSVPQAAAIALGNYGPEAKEAAPHLLKLFRSTDDDETRGVAIFALGRIKAEPKETVALFVNLLNDPKYEAIRARVARSLGDFGSDAAPAVPHLARALANGGVAKTQPQRNVQGAIIQAIGHIGGKEALSTLPLLTRIATDEEVDRSLRNSAIQTIATFGPEAKPALPALIALLEQPKNSTFDLEIAKTIKAIGPDGIGELTKALARAKGKTARRLIHVLGNIGAPAKIAIPAIQAKAEDPNLRREIEMVIRRIDAAKE